MRWVWIVVALSPTLRIREQRCQCQAAGIRIRDVSQWNRAQIDRHFHPKRNVGCQSSLMQHQAALAINATFTTALWYPPQVKAQRKNNTTSRTRTLHRSHAWPVLLLVASFLRTWDE